MCFRYSALVDIYQTFFSLLDDLDDENALRDIKYAQYLFLLDSCRYARRVRTKMLGEGSMEAAFDGGDQQAAANIARQVS